MWTMNAISSYVLVVGLLTLFVLILIWQRQRTQKTVAIWLAAGVIGLLLGSIGSFAAVQLSGHEVTQIQVASEEETGDPVDDDESSGGGMPAMGGGGMGGGGMGGGGMGGGGMGRGGMGGGGMGGMGGGMGGMFGGPRPKRDLTTLVRKIELLTGDVSLKLADDQTSAILKELAKVDQSETMSDDEAEAKHEALLAILDDAQKAKLDAIRPAFRRRGGGGGRGGGGRGGSGGGGFGGFGGGGQDEDANPFTQETNTEALAKLRQRFSNDGEPKKKPCGEQ